jgi:hypothetical protein
MKYTIKTRYFLKNEEAVSEEFTNLPVLSIVMVGLTLFIVLLAQTYIVYTDRVGRLQRYQTADALMQRLTNPDCFFIREGGLIDVSYLKKENSMLQYFFERYTKNGFCYLFQLQWDNQSWVYPENVTPSQGNRIAMSMPFGIYLNEAQTVLGTLTIMLWKGS